MSRNHDRSDVRDDACQDCVVAVTAQRGTSRHLGPDELRALSVLANAGMIAPLRLNATSRPRTPQLPRSWAFPATRAS
jgi:hypothetical protein